MSTSPKSSTNSHQNSDQSTSPRALRRAKTQEEFNYRYKEHLKRIGSRSDQLRRKHNPNRKAERLLDELANLPRPRSASTSEAYLQALQEIRDNSPGYDNEMRIQELEKKPDLNYALHVARRSGSIVPLVGWPDSVWTADVFRRLLFRREVVQEMGIKMTIALARQWLHGASENTEFREDGAAKTLLIFIINELDDWKPDPNAAYSLFWQCCTHYTQLSDNLLQLLERLQTSLNILPEVLLRAINLNEFMQRALSAGFSIAQTKKVMKQFLTPSPRRQQTLHDIYRLMFPSYQIPNEEFV